MSRLSFAAPKRHRKTAWATGLSLVLHVLALSGMALGLKVLAPPPEDRAIALRLIPQSEFQLRPESVRRPPERSAIAAPARPRPTARSSPEAPVGAAPKAPEPGAREEAQAAAGPKALLPSLSGRLGCDDSLGARLTADQRQACADNLARLGRQATPFPLDIPERKQAAYDLHVYCREAYRQAGIPPMTEYHTDGAPVTGPEAGLGYVPGKCIGKGK